MVIFRNLKLGVGGSGGIELNCKFTFKNIKKTFKYSVKISLLQNIAAIDQVYIYIHGHRDIYIHGHRDIYIYTDIEIYIYTDIEIYIYTDIEISESIPKI